MSKDHKFYWLNPKIEPQPTLPRGDGLFAKSKAKNGECIVMVGGVGGGPEFGLEAQRRAIGSRAFRGCCSLRRSRHSASFVIRKCNFYLITKATVAAYKPTM